MLKVCRMFIYFVGVNVNADCIYTGIVQPVPNRPHGTSSEHSLLVIMILNEN